MHTVVLAGFNLAIAPSPTLPRAAAASAMATTELKHAAVATSFSLEHLAFALSWQLQLTAFSSFANVTSLTLSRSDKCRTCRLSIDSGLVSRIDGHAAEVTFMLDIATGHTGARHRGPTERRSCLLLHEIRCHPACSFSRAQHELWLHLTRHSWLDTCS